jgi:hypothetical protein
MAPEPASGNLAAPSVRRAKAGDASDLALLVGLLGYPTAASEMAARLNWILPLEDHLVLVAERCARVVGVIAATTAPRLELNGRCVAA